LGGGRPDVPGAVLFACNRNAIRSPIAAALLRHLAGHRIYVESAGVRPGDPDPFACAVMEEMGIDLTVHRPVSLRDLGDTNFDLIVTLAPEAHHQALELTRTQAVDVEYWPTPDPTLASGNRDQILEAYRGVRDGLFAKIRRRLPMAGAPTV
jgi:protein-tyrosine-phosphatase